MSYANTQHEACERDQDGLGSLASWGACRAQGFPRNWRGNLQDGEWRLLERWGKHYKNVMSLSLSCTFHSFEKVKTSGLAINNSGWVLLECCRSKTVGVILTPNVGSYWHGPFPQTTGNSYLPSWPSSPPDTSPSCGTISLYCHAIPVRYCMLPTAVGEAQPGGVMRYYEEN